MLHTPTFQDIFHYLIYELEQLPWPRHEINLHAQLDPRDSNHGYLGLIGQGYTHISVPKMIFHFQVLPSCTIESLEPWNPMITWNYGIVAS